MKAITLWQPWATAVVLGLKTVETRTKATLFRGQLAIHAAKNWNHHGLAALELFERLFPGAFPEREAFPLGAVVAVAELHDVRAITPSFVQDLGPRELAFGNYSLPGPGQRVRWAWSLRDVNALSEPLELKGHQWLWELPLADVLAITARMGRAA